MYLRLLPLLMLSILMPSVILNAQTFNVKWSEQSKFSDDFDDAVPLSNGGYIVLKIKTRKGIVSISPQPNLVLVNKNMVQTKEVSLQIEDDQWEGHGLKVYGGNVFYLYDVYSRKEKTTTVYALRIDPATLAVKEKIILGAYDSDNRKDQADAGLKLSADSSKILLFVEGPERKKENKKFFVAVFDTQLKNIWKKDVELPNR